MKEEEGDYSPRGAAVSRAGAGGTQTESRSPAAGAEGWEPTFPRSPRPSASAPRCGLQICAFGFVREQVALFEATASVVLISVNIISINRLFNNLTKKKLLSQKPEII